MRLLNFRRRGYVSLPGSYSHRSARKLVDKQFSKLSISPRAQRYLAKEIDRSGKLLDAREMDEIINKAHQKGLVSSRSAEKMKDIIKLPDNFNKHWE